MAAKPKASWWLGALVFQFFSAIYGGYFGAGQQHHDTRGVGPALVCMTFTAPTASRISWASASTALRIIGFALSHLVSWPEALLMAAGALVGGYFGASVAVRHRAGIRAPRRRSHRICHYVCYVVASW